MRGAIGTAAAGGTDAIRPTAAMAIGKYFIRISFSAPMRKCQREHCCNVPLRDNAAIWILTAVNGRPRGLMQARPP